MSGGADSLALAVLTADWAEARGGRVSGLIVDHGLRAGSAAEARHVAAVLAGLGISPRILSLSRLGHGPGLAARARIARYGVLTAACASDGILHLLIGHHLADQAETVTMRRLAGSGAAGLAAMAALVETAETRLLRPLLDIAPVRLRATLRARGLSWVEDPSNADPAAQRARLRAMAADPDGTGPAIAALAQGAARHGSTRAGQAERDAARWLARHAEIRPEGYALVDDGVWDSVATASLLRLLGGAEHAPSPRSVARLAAAPRPATLGGVRVMRAGKWRPGGWLLVREAAAMRPATAGIPWDGRFRPDGAVRHDAVIGPRGVGARAGRDMLPSAVLRTLPCLTGKQGAGAFLHLSTQARFLFAPARPASCAPFAPMQPGC